MAISHSSSSIPNHHEPSLHKVQENLAEGVDDGLVSGLGVEVGVEEQGVVLGSPGVLCHC